MIVFTNGYHPGMMKPLVFWVSVAACVLVGVLEALARTVLEQRVPWPVRRALRRWASWAP